jgi:biotin synthase-related radical SAM superfamily protein
MFYKQKMNSKDGYQSHCKVCDNARKLVWKQANPALDTLYKVTTEQNRLQNPKRREYKKQLKKMPHIKAANNASYAKRRAAKICRTPKWLTQQDHKVMKAFYSVAQMLTRVNNEAWHVDHNIPLQAKLVSGLHVPKNLVLMRGIENETKRNFYIVG